MKDKIIFISTPGALPDPSIERRFFPIVARASHSEAYRAQSSADRPLIRPRPLFKIIVDAKLRDDVAELLRFARRHLRPALIESHGRLRAILLVSACASCERATNCEKASRKARQTARRNSLTELALRWRSITTAITEAAP